MDVDLTKLPISIRRQIPMSLKSYKDVYDLEELPLSVQYLIKDYFEKTFSVKYDVVYDLKPYLSQYSDFQSVDNLTNLVVEYLKNYLLILPEAYPFDPYFGSRLKYQLQTRDINLRQTIISSEINNIIGALVDEVGVDVTVESIQIIPVSTAAETDYNVTILLKINNEQLTTVNMEFIA